MNREPTCKTLFRIDYYKAVWNPLLNVEEFTSGPLIKGSRILYREHVDWLDHITKVITVQVQYMQIIDHCETSQRPHHHISRWATGATVCVLPSAYVPVVAAWLVGPAVRIEIYMIPPKGKNPDN